MALDLVIGPLISLATKKAGDALIEQYCTMHNMKKNREKLRRNLLAIQAVISSAESRAANEPHVRAWVDKLRDTAYEAVDVLDEFQYEALRQEANRQKPSSSFKKVTKVIIPDKSPIFSNKMSKKLKNVLEKINEIITEMNDFNFIRGIAYDSQPNMSRARTHSFIIESEIIGREYDKECVINMLLNPDCEKHNISVLPIVGMGGAGKTTLTQLIYNEKKVKDKFELQMWVCVSNDFDVENIVKNIIEVVENGKPELSNNIEVLQKHLRTILKNKKYLLVLDDVWNEERSKWDDLKTLLSSSFKSGSVILVTTRSNKVASITGTLPPHDLKMLSAEDSWKLFQKRAFVENEELDEQLVSFGQKIVDKCAGLPLALKTIGALMRDKREVPEWHAISESKFWDGEIGADKILPALKLSYDHLPGYMKQCFVFCAIFPQDYKIEKETLIQLWIANDLISADERNDLEGKGRIIFDELCWRSFFQDVEVNYSKFYDESYLETTTCKMHDLMHDLAKHVAGNLCGSVLYFSSLDKSQPENLNCVLKEHPVVRTCLITEGFKKKLEDDKHPHLEQLISLRALEVRWIDQSPMEVRCIRLLKYLDLSFGKFDTLPDTISTLYNLQTLKLSSSSVSKLPDGMRYMVSLRHLFIDGCRQLKRMPVRLGQLKCLKTLTNYMVECEQGRTIRELKQLNLCGSLFLSGLENIKDKNEASDANMVSKSDLYSLTLKWNSTDDKDSTRTDLDVLDGLRPNTKLKFLSMYGYAGNDFANWMKDKLVLRNLKALYFQDCLNCTTLPPVWCLPFLEELYLINLKSLLYICNCQSVEGEESKNLIIFSNLKVLDIEYLDNLVGWHEKNNELVTFPQLIELSIWRCPTIRMIPCTPLLQKIRIDCPREMKLLEISNMNSVALSEVQIGSASLREPEAFRPPKYVVYLSVSGFENVIPLEEDGKEDYQNMALRVLQIVYCNNCFFVCGPSKVALGFWKYFASLETLIIRSCKDLSTWPEEEFRGLKCLKFLEIGECVDFTGLSHASLSSIKPSREDILPRLESLRIYSCPKFEKIPRRCMSLKSLHLGSCPSVSKEWFNKLKNLHELTLQDFEGLESLPEDLECLKCLRIDLCPGIQSFPQSLQQRLSELESLKIYGCPVLQRLCRSGGEYQHLVSAISDLEIKSDRFS